MLGINKLLVNICHPVGTVFSTTNADFNPNTTWGGTWEQLTGDAYLKIVTSNAGEYNGTSSSHQIPISSMPSHTHSVSYSSGSSVIANDLNGGVTQFDTSGGLGACIIKIANTGGGNAYYPYYYGVYTWHRTA